MQIGVCTWIFGDVDLERVLHAAARSGGDGIELLGNLPPSEASRVRRLLTEEGLSVFSRTPIDMDRHGREIDLAYPDATVRRLGYRGPWIVECTSPEANPFVADPKNFDHDSGRSCSLYFVSTSSRSGSNSLSCKRLHGRQ